MKATWIRVWTVAAGGDHLSEREASIVGELVTTRPVGGAPHNRGGQRWSRPTFEHQFATSPEAAIEKFLTEQRATIGNYEQRIAMCRLLITRAEALSGP